MPLDFKSLLCENGQSGTLWQSLTSAERMRYADLSNEQLGLVGEYYYGQNFESLQNTVVDSQISFYWGNGDPDALPGRIDDFSIRWSGYLVPSTNETYTFYLGSDDGSRLYIDGELVINNWQNQAHNVETATYRLRAGRYYNIVVEYYESAGGASVELEWSSNSVARQVIAGNNLRHGIEFRVYSSIVQWNSDRARNLVTLDETESLEIRGQWTSTTESISFSGWATDSDHKIFITANGISEGGYRWSNPTRPSHKRFSPATGSATYIENISVRLTNLHISSSTNNCISINNSAEHSVEIVNCYLWQESGTHSNVYIDSNNAMTTILSSIIEGGSIGVQSTSGHNSIVNSTITGAQTGVSTSLDSLSVNSCAVFNNFGNDWSGSFGEGKIKNCASDDQPVVSDNWINISPAAEQDGWTAAFYDWLNRDYRPRDASSVLYNSGNSNIISGYYDQLNIPFVDIGFAPRETVDVGACSLTDWKDFRYRRRIAVKVPSADVDTNLADFPLYINLGSIPLSSSLWSEARTKELRISNKDRIAFPQETVFFDKNTNRGELWAKVDLSSTEDTEFYVYYGYEPVIAGLDEEVTPLDNVAGQHETWSDYVFVHHLQTYGEWIDSTENGYDGYTLPIWTLPTIEEDGRFGNSQLFNGNDNAFSLGYVPTDATWTGITMEAWYRKNDAADERIICLTEPSNTNVATHIYALHSGQPANRNRISMRLATDQNTGVQLNGNTGFTYGTWQYSVGTWSSTDNLMQVFLNQNLDNSMTQAGNHIRAVPGTYRTVIGQMSETHSPGRYWGGGLDELRLAKTRFPNHAARIKAQYLNQTSEAFSETQPETFNPVKPEPPVPPIEYSSSDYITGATNLSSAVEINSNIEDTDRAVVALVSWKSTATLNFVRFNGVDMTLVGNHSTGGTGTDINQTAIYAINESQLPAAAGSYTGSAQLSANSNAAITFVYLDRINQTDLGYTSKATTGSFFETEIDFTLEEPGQTAIDVLSLPVEGNTLVEEEGQTRIVDIDWSTTSHSVSFKTFSESGAGRLSWYNNQIATRASNSVILLKTTTPLDYQYKASGKITTFGSADCFLDYWKFYEGSGGIVVSYESDQLNDRSLEIARDGYGSIDVSGENNLDDLELITDPEFGSVIASYDSDPLEDRTIEFEREGTVDPIVLDGINYLDDLELVTDPDFGSIYLAYDSDPLEDRTIIFSYTSEGDIKLSGDHNPIVLELIFAMIGEIVLHYDSDPLEDRTIELTRIVSGTTTANVEILEADWIDLITDPEFGSIYLAYDSDQLEDRTIEFERTMSGGISVGGTVPEADWIEAIYIVDPSGDPITLGGSDYSISFSREMSGGISMGGTVPDFDFVVLVTVVIEEPIILSYSTEDNEVHLPKPSLSFGRARFTRITSAPFQLEWEHTPITFRSIKIKGTTTAKVTATALFTYSGSGRILLRRVKAKYELSIEKYYIGSGGIRFLKIARPKRIYSYYPIFSYNSVYGGFTLIGGMWHISIRATVISSAIVLSGTSTIEDFTWNYKYKAAGKITTKRIVNRPTLNFSYISRTTRNVKVRGSVSKPRIIPSYLYTGTGLILVKQASIHRYKASGTITINGSVVSDEQTKSYRYKASGRIFTRRMKNLYSLSIFVVAKQIKLRTKISFKRKLELLSTTAYGSIVVGIGYSSNFEIARSLYGTIKTKIYSEIEKEYDYVYLGKVRAKTSIKSDSTSSQAYYASGRITISGNADLSYAYTASGFIVISISSESIKTPSFKYIASGRIRVPRKKSAIVQLIRTPKLRGRITTKGAAKYKAVYYWPNYSSTAQLNSNIAAEYSHTNNYVFEAAGTLTTTASSESEFYLLKEYSAFGKVNSIISGEYEWSPDYLYSASGKINAKPVSIGFGRRDFAYAAGGVINSKITGKTLRRTVIVRFANGAFIDQFNEDRTVKEPLAGTVFKYKV